VGANQLIQKGAKLVCSAEEIAEDLSPQMNQFLKRKPPEPEQMGEAQGSVDALVQLLAPKPMNFDELLLAARQTPPELYSRLIRLEMAGQIRRLPGGEYQANPTACKGA